MSKVSARRNSTGGTIPRSSSSGSIKDEKIVPNYLRATTGSCHDLCKYGHRNPFEEDQKLSGGRRKKLPTQLKNLALHKSVMLDGSKDVKHRNLSLTKSSMSLGEADRIGLYEPLVPRTASSGDHKSMNSDGKKKKPEVEQKAPAISRNSSGLPKFDQKVMMPSAKLKLVEKTSPEKPRTLEKATLIKQPLFMRPTLLPSKPHLIKEKSLPSCTSVDLHSKHLNSSKDKISLNGKLKSQPTTSSNTGARQSNNSKAGRTLTRASIAKIKGKEDKDVSGPSFSTESELTAAAETQELCEVTLDSFEHKYHDQQLSEPSSTAKECVDKLVSVPEETSRSNLEDERVESNKNNEALENEDPLKSAMALDQSLQQSSNGQELESVLSKSIQEYKQTEQHASDFEVSEDQDEETIDAAPCQLSKQSSAVEPVDGSNSELTETSSEVEADGDKVITTIESLVAEGKGEVGAHEDHEESPESLALHRKHAEEFDHTLRKKNDFNLGNIAESIKLDEIDVDSKAGATSCCQSNSDSSSDGELLEEPKSVLIEPSDSTVKNAELGSIDSDDPNECKELEPRTVVQQLPEELSDDEFDDESYFELSETDESGSEDEGAAINRNNDESSKADGQRPRRTSAPNLDGTSAKPYKLKFKRGKVVELTPDSNGAKPKKLKFRSRAADEVASGNGLLGRRISKRNGINVTVPSNPNPNVEAPGVKLRHQDTQGKKDTQGLFNNVIEETASKLVESRKSKVKALVGAFETVISLQDGKPTSSTSQVGNLPHPVDDDRGNSPEGAT